MQRYALKIEYDGTNFCGFQTQPSKRTIQQELEGVLSVITNEKTSIFASGRTDAGVHALAQIVHFDSKSDIEIGKLIYLLNKNLPSDIMVKDAAKVSKQFDARKTAKKKSYIYKFYLSRYDRPTLKNKALRVNDNIDVKKMQMAVKDFVGTYDFTSFVARKSGKTNFVRTIYSATIKKIEGDMYQLEICANGFLYNMVRIILGTLLDIGAGRKNVDSVKEIIAGKNRKLAGKTVAPDGLYLKQVSYPSELLDFEKNKICD